MVQMEFISFTLTSLPFIADNFFFPSTLSHRKAINFLVEIYGWHYAIIFWIHLIFTSESTTQKQSCLCRCDALVNVDMVLMQYLWCPPHQPWKAKNEFIVLIILLIYEWFMDGMSTTDLNSHRKVHCWLVYMVTLTIIH